MWTVFMKDFLKLTSNLIIHFVLRLNSSQKSRTGRNAFTKRASCSSIKASRNNELQHRHYQWGYSFNLASFLLLQYEISTPSTIRTNATLDLSLKELTSSGPLKDLARTQWPAPDHELVTRTGTHQDLTMTSLDPNQYVTRTSRESDFDQNLSLLLKYSWHDLDTHSHPSVNYFKRSCCLWKLKSIQ